VCYVKYENDAIVRDSLAVLISCLIRNVNRAMDFYRLQARNFTIREKFRNFSLIVKFA